MGRLWDVLRRHCRAMTRSVILRIAPSALRAGRLAGEVESIETGRRAVVRSTEELLAFICADALPTPSGHEDEEPRAR